MAWNYEEMEARVREAAAREGNTAILELSSEEHRSLLKEVEEYWIYLQDQKITEERKARCRAICEAIKTTIDVFNATEWSARAWDFVIRFGDRCLLTCAVEYNIPLYFQMEFLEIDGIKIRIDSLLGAIVGEIDEEEIVELQLDRVYVDTLLTEIANNAAELRKMNALKIVDRYKDEEYTAELKM